MANNHSTQPIGWTGRLSEWSRKVRKGLSHWWIYVGISMFLAFLNLLLGIATLSSVKPKKEPLVFGLLCFGVVLALSHFASLCYLLQRSKDEMVDPTYIDVTYAAGVTLLFVVSGIALTVQLPSRCFSGQNYHFRNMGRGACVSLTTMAVSSWLAVIITSVAAVMLFLAARKAIEISRLPPPVFPTATEAPIMRWLDRNDPFRVASSRLSSNV